MTMNPQVGSAPASEPHHQGDIEAANGTAEGGGEVVPKVEVRNRPKWRGLVELWDSRHVILELYSASCVFIMYLVTLESILVSTLSALVTLFYCTVKFGDHKFAGNLSWTFISFAIIFPLTYSYGEAFKRREEGLAHLAGMKANLCWLYMSHADWSFGTDTSRGRLNLGEGHVEEVLSIMLTALSEMRTVLCLPTTRTRHVITSDGVSFAQTVKMRGRMGALKIVELFQALSRKVEDMVILGLPGPEASRIKQVAMSALDHWEHLNKIKMYRTPQSTRSFARIFIWIHPFFFGPYYSFVAGGLVQGTNSWTNEYFAMALSVLTTMAMVGLFNIRYALEDPFNEREGLLDAIHTRQEFEDIKAALLTLTPEIAEKHLTRRADGRLAQAGTALAPDLDEMTQATRMDSAALDQILDLQFF